MNQLLIFAILIISTLPLYAQGQAPNAAELAKSSSASSVAIGLKLRRHYLSPTGLEVFIIRRDRRGDVLEYCPSGLGDTHEATAVH